MHLMGFQVYSFSMSFNYFFLIISLFFNINALMYKIIKREREKHKILMHWFRELDEHIF
jgi:hypothetical protein